MNKSYVYSRVMMEHLLYIWHVYTHIHMHMLWNPQILFLWTSWDRVGSLILPTRLSTVYINLLKVDYRVGGA